MVDPGEGPGGLDPPFPTPPSGIIRNYNVQLGLEGWGVQSVGEKQFDTKKFNSPF